MQVNWSAVSGAIAYEAQWRRNDGNWINVPRSSTTSFEVSGIYAGRYLVRVRAINAAEISSGWAYSEEKTLTGKVGEPLAPLALATRSLVHGVQVSWEFPTGSRIRCARNCSTAKTRTAVRQCRYQTWPIRGKAISRWASVWAQNSGIGRALWIVLAMKARGPAGSRDGQR